MSDDDDRVVIVWPAYRPPHEYGPVTPADAPTHGMVTVVDARGKRRREAVVLPLLLRRQWVQQNTIARQQVVDAKRATEWGAE